MLEAGMAELADAADLKSAGAILVGSSPSPGTKQRVNMKPHCQRSFSNPSPFIPLPLIRGEGIYFLKGGSPLLIPF